MKKIRRNIPGKADEIRITGFHNSLSHIKLAVTADDAKALVTEMAQAYEKPEQMVSEVMGNPRSAQAYMNLALEEKVVDFVLGAAKTTDETVTFDDLMKTAQ